MKIKEMIYTLWKYRNQKLHPNNTHNQVTNSAVLIQRITKLYDLREKMNSHDKAQLFPMDLETMLKESHESFQDWLLLSQPNILKSVHKHQT